ncbi:hypothetical protein AA313_de0207957 [Arthrobotrys entomopaga]|nr:hypothetical protein AA313_de0207957 [Arthrobotrys entomopaga]
MSDRSRMPPRQSSHSSASSRRELVYCHRCQNEWYRDQHGLECPSCHSDFTEILENDSSDPREDMHGDDFSDDDNHDDFGHRHFPGPSHDYHGIHNSQPPGFTLRMGGNSGPSISFRTIRTEYGGGSPSGHSGHTSPPGNLFGAGHVTGGLSQNPNPRSPFAPPNFDHFPPSASRSQGQSPLPPDPSRRPPPTPTPNFGNGGGPIAEMFTSIIQNIIGNNANDNNPRGPFYNQQQQQQQQQEQQQQQPGMGAMGGMPGGFPGGPFGDPRYPGAGQNNPGQGSHQAEGFGQGSRSNNPTPPGMPENPFFSQVPRGRGMTYYSSTRTWTGPNGEVRTIRTSSPMPPPGGQDNQQAALDLTEILVSILGANAQGGDEAHGVPPFLRAFGLGHGPSGDYVWSQQDMDRILSQLMEQHQGNAPPPASEEAIKNLPKVKVTQEQVDEGTECVICQDEYKSDEEVVKLPCKHLYHEECVKRWLETHDACPICRTPITPEDQRPRRPGPPGTSGGPPQAPFGGNPGPSSAGGSGSGGNPNMQTSSGSGGGNGARWSWSASFGRSN